MMDLSYTLPVVWALIVGFTVVMYVVLDGFDLGVGILFPFFPDEGQRDQMMNSVAPFWDGNETWLILGGNALLVAFPLAFAIIMPAVYLPIIFMLLALIFRGVSFEYRWVAKPHHRKWDIAFTAGSTMAAFSQGLVLGGLLQGIPVKNGQFAGDSLFWLTPFSVMCGLALVAGYALLGAAWVTMKTEGEVERKARRLGTPLLFILLGFIGLVSIWTPLQFPAVAERWFSIPNIFYLGYIPVLTLLAAWWCWHSLRTGKSVQPFIASVSLFLLAYIGLVASYIPYLVPPSITIWEAASDLASQIFMLVGTIILLPLVLGYTFMVFWLFRGKLRPGEGYH